VGRNTRASLIFLVCILFFLTARVVVAFARYSKLERQVAFIQIGDSRASVIARMGMPNYYSGTCGVIHFPDKKCTVEYVYSHPFAPLVPEYHIVAFSEDDRVIESDE
jgi:hypothetical protein